MKQIQALAQYYVDLMMKPSGPLSMLLALALVVLAIVVQMAVTARSVWPGVGKYRRYPLYLLCLLITPWAVYFLSVVVEQLEESRQRLSRLVDKLEESAVSAIQS
ncbi:hypothetical protein MJ561_26200 [Klebsiella pneumoniae]|nr:hypothetical protein MJ561_26200 [Klebsiella pneumoniae]